MKRKLCALLIAVLMAAGSSSAGAQSDEPTIYVVKQGDTLWGLSSRFLKDPYYWPDLWAKNDPTVTNPHLIFPGQKLRVFPDRIVPAAPTGFVPAEQISRPVTPDREASLETPPVEDVVKERTFEVLGGAGFIMEKDVKPLGLIVATNMNRHLIGTGGSDSVYTDIGRDNGARSGDRFSIFRNMGPVSHPMTSAVMGNKVIPQGVLQLLDVEAKSSRATVVQSFQETDAGSYLMPYRERRREVVLTAASRDLSGHIIDTQSGSRSVAGGDVVFLDLGTSQGLAVGNLLYVCRDVDPENTSLMGGIDRLPVEVVGAPVVVETGEKTATALIVKSIDAIFLGDRVELKKSR